VQTRPSACGGVSEHSVPVLADHRGNCCWPTCTACCPRACWARPCTTQPQWHKLKRYVEDGRYSIDNNVQENAIRPFCVGRRNWLFADTVAGAHASANLYSLLQTCRVNGIDGYRYLRSLFEALPRAKTADNYAALLPWRIALDALDTA
jgi:hypothetical protein